MHRFWREKLLCLVRAILTHQLYNERKLVLGLVIYLFRFRPILAQRLSLVRSFISLHPAAVEGLIVLLSL